MKSLLLIILLPSICFATPNINNKNINKASGGSAAATGEASSYSKSISGGSSASVGDSSSASEGGYAESGDVSINNSRSTASSQSAPLYSAGCQSGSSGQVMKGGVNILVEDIVCQSLRIADAHALALSRCKKDKPECLSFHEQEIHKYLDIAGDHIDSTKTTAKIAKNASNTGITALGIGTLIWILIAI